MATNKLVFRLDDGGAKAKIAALQDAANDLTPVYQTVGRVVLTRIRLCFKLGIDPWGSPWAKLKFRAPRGRFGKDGAFKPSKAGEEQIKRNAAGAVGQALVNTGRMRDSITAAADGSGVTIGTNLRTASGVSYPAVHQFGATITPKNAKRLVFPGPNGALVFAKKVAIPARPFLPLKKGSTVVQMPPEWSKLITDALKDYFTKQLAKA